MKRRQHLRHGSRVSSTLITATLFACLACSKDETATEGCSDVIAGAWRSACQDLTALGDVNIRSVRITHTFGCASYERLHEFYLDANCSQLALTASLPSSYYSKLGDAGTESTSRAINLYFPAGLSANLPAAKTTTSIIVLADLSVRTDFSARQVCDPAINWNSVTTQDRVDFMEKNCQLAAGYSIQGPADKSTRYDIYRIDTSVSPPVLVFGDPASGMGTSEGTRPSNLLVSLPFTKLNLAP